MITDPTQSILQRLSNSGVQQPSASIQVIEPSNDPTMFYDMRNAALATQQGQRSLRETANPTYQPYSPLTPFPAAQVNDYSGSLQRTQSGNSSGPQYRDSPPVAANSSDRDIAIRTILGEAANEDEVGQSAVLHVMMNRVRDGRWGNTLKDVALAPKQFSAWNSGAGGNNLVRKYNPGDAAYDRVGALYDRIMAGNMRDPTGGATHYYSPAGMKALVNGGSQSNLLPRWLQQENNRRKNPPVTIGGHIFTGYAG